MTRRHAPIHDKSSHADLLAARSNAVDSGNSAARKAIESILMMRNLRIVYVK